MEKVQSFRAAQDLQARAASTAAAPRQLRGEALGAAPGRGRRANSPGMLGHARELSHLGPKVLPPELSLYPRMPTADGPDHPFCPAISEV